MKGILIAGKGVSREEMEAVMLKLTSNGIPKDMIVISTPEEVKEKQLELTPLKEESFVIEHFPHEACPAVFLDRIPTKDKKAQRREWRRNSK